MLLFRAGSALFLASFISYRALRKKSLSVAGAAGALCAGLVHMICGWTFGAVLIVFFLTSSKLTRLKQERKAELDESFKLEGQRGLKQVLCNSLGGSVAAVVAIHPAVAGSKHREAVIQLLAWSAFLGHYACCCADTWASELGMLSRRPPRLITSLRRVPPGVNGAVSGEGLAASAAGGLCMGAVLWLVGTATGETSQLQPLIVSITKSITPAAGCAQAVFWLLLGLCAGLAGSVMDSLLGATVQFSGYCHKSHKVVAHTGPNIQHISGSPWLSNEAVNAVSAGLSGVAAACGVGWILRTAG